MRGEQGISLTPAGRCHNPQCGASVYAELISADLHDFRLCVDCEERHGHRLREKIAEAEERPRCSEACCRKNAA
jgi:hypothetical protein